MRFQIARRRSRAGRAASLWRAAIACLSAAAFFATAQAANSAPISSPAGTWITIDDVTGKPKSVVSITVTNGAAEGTILKILSDPGGAGICDRCAGDLKGHSLVGLRILSNVTQDGDQWDGGLILDPGNGNTYNVRLRLLDEGRKLEVRGYIGLSLFGRSQIWQRAN